MAILIQAPEDELPIIPGRIALIDADVIAYYSSFGLDEYHQGAVDVKIANRCLQIEKETQAEHFRYYLTGKNNFRNQVAKLKQYKGNRYDKNGNRIKPQPKHLQYARAWLMDNKNAVVSDNQEADDAISIAAATVRKHAAQGGQYHTIISTVDKDLGINPGLFHNHMDSSIIDIDEFGELHMAKSGLKGTGLKFFYAQMLMGDSTDYIPGLPKTTEYQVKVFGCKRGGCGDSKAFATLDSADTVQECFNRVAMCYEEYWADRPFTHWKTGEELKLSWLSMMEEQGQLLWMRQKERQLWRVPIELLEGYQKWKTNPH